MHFSSETDTDMNFSTSRNKGEGPSDRVTDALASCDAAGEVYRGSDHADAEKCVSSIPSRQSLIPALRNCARRFWLHTLPDESGVAVKMAMPTGTCSALDQRRARDQNLRPQRRLRNLPQDEQPHSTETGRLQRDGAAAIRLFCGRGQQGAFILYVTPGVLSSWTTTSSPCLRC